MKLDFSIRERLGIGFSLMIGLVLLLAGVTHSRLHQMQEAVQTLTEVIAERADAAVNVERAFLNQSIALHSFIATGDVKYLNTFKQEHLIRHRELDRLNSLRKSADGGEIYARMLQITNHYDTLANETIALVENNRPRAEIDAAEVRLRDLRSQLIQATRQYTDLQNRKRGEASRQLLDLDNQLINSLVVLTACILAAGIITALVVIRAVRRPATRLVEVIGAVERGDYTPALEQARAWPPQGGAPRDELAVIARAFGRMAEATLRREKRLAADGRLAGLLGASLDVSRLASGTLAEMLAFSGCEGGAVYVADPETGALGQIACTAFQIDAAQLAPEGGIAAEAARHGVVVRHQDAQSPCRIMAAEGVPRLPRFLAAAPLKFQGRPCGCILMGALGELAPEIPEFIQHSADHLSISLQNALSHVETKKLADDLHDKNRQLEEQNRILAVQRAQLQALSERLQLQNEEIQHQSEEIKARNEELQHALAGLRENEQKLRQQAERLAEADRRKDEFLAMLAHELRNPLAAISNASYILEASPAASTEQSARLNRIVARQVRHLARLVDDLLDVSRITRGKVVLRKEPVDLRLAVQHAVEANQGQIEAQRQHLEVDLPPDPVTLLADPTRLEQMIGNLLNNAIKYTEPEGRIWLEADAKGGEVLVRVRDTGIGIAPDVLPHVFDLFIQAQSGPDRAKGGLGIGLTMVKSLAELHGGAVEAFSAGIGKGSVFTLRIPRSADGAG